VNIKRARATTPGEAAGAGRGPQGYQADPDSGPDGLALGGPSDAVVPIEPADASH
jgi:hypothetical protein